MGLNIKLCFLDYLIHFLLCLNLFMKLVLDLIFISWIFSSMSNSDLIYIF